MTRRVLPLSPTEFVARRPLVAPNVSGFVVLELLATICLLGSLGAVGLSNLHRDKPQVGGSLQLLAADLLWARSEAIRLDTPVRVTYSATTNSYRVAYEGDDSTSYVAFERDLKRDFPLARLVPTASTDAATQTFLFDARGVPQGLQTAAKVEIASSLDPTFKRCLFINPKGLITANETCSL